MDSLRWGIVGEGPVARGFVRALGHAPVASGPAALRDPAVQVVFVASPTAEHHAHCLAAIEAGKHVLCEKPMTASPGELADVLAAARRQGVFVMEGMWLRFNPVMQQYRDFLHSGAAGEVVSGEMPIGYADHVPGTPLVGGITRDALAEFGCYGLSVAEWLFGMPQALRATATSTTDGAVLQGDLCLRYPGFEFLVTSSIVATLPNRLTIVTTLGTLTIPTAVLDPGRLSWTPHGRPGLAGQLATRVRAAAQVVGDRLRLGQVPKGSGWQGEIREVTECIARGATDSDTNPASATVTVHALTKAARDLLATGDQSWSRVSASSF